MLLFLLSFATARASILDEPDATIYPTPGLDLPNFAESISAAGDVNGDGYADLLISDREFADDSGVVFLHLGSPDGLSASPDLTLEGSVLGDWFGFETEAAGDVNGDGLDDIVVGTAYGDEAFVYYGEKTAGLASTPTVLTGTAGTYFGRSVGSAGDVNDDGFADVAVGSREAGVSVYLGSARGLETTPTVLEIPYGSLAELLGTDVDGAGDVDGDGYGDLIVGAYGSAFLFRGGSSGIDPVAPTEFPAPPWALNEWDHGSGVAGAGDVNGDGYDDVAFSRSVDDVAYLALGGPSGMSGIPDTTFPGLDGGNLGSELEGDFDFDADGYSDLLLGEPPIYDFGHAYIYAGGASGPSTVATWDMVGLADGENLGIDVAAIGDANGDGYDDVAVGTERDEVRIYYGRARDDDGDGSTSLDDCNDLDPAVHPGALEVAGDEVDQNCDGSERCFVDADGDGCRTPASVRSRDTDCSDAGEAPLMARRDMNDASATPRMCMR